MNEKELVDYLSKYFTYKADGSLDRSDRKNSNGSYDKDGYLIIKIKGKQYKAHRLVYAIHHGFMPAGELDHINRIRNDNRIENLRLASRKENNLNTNRKPNRNTGVVGVHLDKTNGLKKKYATKLDGRTYRFYTVEDAVKKRRIHYKDYRGFIYND